MRARRGPLAAALGLLTLASCGSPIVKTDALDPAVLEQVARIGLLLEGEDEERVVRPDSRWLATEPGALTFASYRRGEKDAVFALVLESTPEEDRLVLLPLSEGETPLDVLAHEARVAELEAALAEHGRGEPLPGTLVLPLHETVAEKRLGPPLPEPRKIVAVAANFQSHLEVDLDIDPELIARIAKTPPRVFQKHPPLAAPGPDPRSEPPFRGVIGPYDTVLYPDRISLPYDEDGRMNVVETALDYEVEVGCVIGRVLDWEDVAVASDEELWDAVAGYVLVSDIKARNPQVFERLLSRHETPTEPEQRYLTGDPNVDEVLGNWNEDTCAWWGYAASQGDYAALGPFFVAAPGGPGLPPRSVLCARSYAPAEERAYEVPGGRRSGVLYLRQCARVTEDPGHRDRLLWSVPAIVRAILAPEGALDLGPGERRLEPGDVIALGTPGGIALTVNRSLAFRLLDSLLCWWDSIDWHDAFFDRDRELYLHQGDQVFLWGEGLGFQLLTIAAFPLPAPE